MMELRGERILLRPIAEGDEPELTEILLSPEVAPWWGPPDEGFPHTDDPDATRFTIVVDHKIAGMIQWAEEKDPDYRHAWIDIYVSPTLLGRGYGTEAVRIVAEHLLIERGHHRVTIDPAAANTRAVRSYEKAGFRPVGILQAAWRDPMGEWQDVLLMEMVRLGTSEASGGV